VEHDPDGEDTHDQDGAIKPNGNTIRRCCGWVCLERTTVCRWLIEGRSDWLFIDMESVPRSRYSRVSSSIRCGFRNSGCSRKDGRDRYMCWVPGDLRIWFGDFNRRGLGKGVCYRLLSSRGGGYWYRLGSYRRLGRWRGNGWIREDVDVPLLTMRTTPLSRPKEVSVKILEVQVYRIHSAASRRRSGAGIRRAPTPIAASPD